MNLESISKCKKCGKVIEEPKVPHPVKSFGFYKSENLFLPKLGF